MSFLDTFLRAKAYLEQQGRVSLAALRREFALDEAALEELIEELVDIQHLAARDGKALAWIGPATPPTREDVAAPRQSKLPPESRKRHRPPTPSAASSP